ncbi:MAG TPA: hypothetical protein VHB69_14405 [Mycobacteriales bacterium]|nr:hypothetical protein [Mycobacteriales bacterium]
MTAMLPAEFADLEPFAATWCLAGEPDRWAQRLASSMEELRAFYDACFPRAEAAIRFCDQFDLAALPEDARNLMHLLFSFALVSYPIEVWNQPLPIDTGSAKLDRTREPAT